MKKKRVTDSVSGTANVKAFYSSCSNTVSIQSVTHQIKIDTKCFENVDYDFKEATFNRILLHDPRQWKSDILGARLKLLTS